MYINVYTTESTDAKLHNAKNTYNRLQLNDCVGQNKVNDWMNYAIS